MSSQTISGIFFDWDLTLAQIMGDVDISWRLAALFQQHGLEIDQPQVAAAIEQFWAGREFVKPQTPQEIIDYYRQLLLISGFDPISQEFGQKLYDGYGLLPNVLYDDALPTLRYLASRPYTLGIISNHSVHARDTMLDLVGDFVQADHIIISDEVGLHKPDPAIFALASERIGLPPDQCVLIGDNLAVDAESAVAQGGFQQGIWLDRSGTGHGRSLPPGVTRITTLLDLRQLL